MDQTIIIGFAIITTAVVGLIIFGWGACLYLLTATFEDGFTLAKGWLAIPRWLRRFGLITLASFLGSGVMTKVTWMVRDRIRPAGLGIHIDALPWESVTVESTNLPKPQLFTAQNGKMLVTPISYGGYRFTIQLTDGRRVWSEYFHSDAGLRRRVDLFVSPSPKTEFLRFRQTINGGDEIFSGEARAEDTSAEKPLPLAGI